MPHKLGLTVVAEGVENEEQRKRALNMLWEILHNILSALHYFKQFHVLQLNRNLNFIIKFFNHLHEN